MIFYLAHINIKLMYIIFMVNRDFFNVNIYIILISF